MRSDAIRADYAMVVRERMPHANDASVNFYRRRVMAKKKAKKAAKKKAKKK